MKRINFILAVSYATIQVTVSIAVSIIGAIHVRQCLQEKVAKTESELAKSIELTISKPKGNTKENENEPDIERDAVKEKETKVAEEKQEKGFCEEWLKTVWKMRSVYGGLAVHSFDVLTDVLVILQWIQTPNVEGDNIDPQVMAYCAIAVMIASKIISAVAIYVKEGNIIRCMLQLCDLLIFQEIYEAHNKVISSFKSKQLKDEQNNNAIESTLSFKYVRSMEAIFESIPESILQMVYVMRTSAIQPIFVISIIQSIVSMTNSILNDDYTRMQEDKWKKHKQRLPPTFACFKHALVRFAEITYRIGLLALLWTVCEGLTFGIILAIDLLLIAGRTLFLFYDEEWDSDTILLSINSLIVIPSDYVYGEETYAWYEYLGCEQLSNGNYSRVAVLLCCNCCFCQGLAALLSSLSAYICFPYMEDVKVDDIRINVIPLSRICVSFTEFTFLILWAFFGGNGERKEFLLSADYGLAIFITTCVCFLIYTQYLVLFPDFSLPLNVNVRSKFGYAFSNEITELKKVKIPLKKMPYDKKYRRNTWEVKDEATFWDEPVAFYNCDKTKPITAAVFALAKGNYDIVEWLEEQGAVRHKGVSTEIAKEMLKIN